MRRGTVGDAMGERLTALLSRMASGDQAARDAVFAAAYQELRRLAHSRLRGGGRDTDLDTTALVHESYLRFVQTGELRIEDRRAFFSYASRVMRSVIVDMARARLAQRRGGDAQKLTLTTEAARDLGQDDEGILRVHEALQQLGCPDPCSKRDAKGFCQRARNSSVEQDVLYFVFPNSAFAPGELALETINTKVKERAFGLYNRLRGAS